MMVIFWWILKQQSETSIVVRSMAADSSNNGDGGDDIGDSVGCAMMKVHHIGMLLYTTSLMLTLSITRTDLCLGRIFHHLNGGNGSNRADDSIIVVVDDDGDGLMVGLLDNSEVKRCECTSIVRSVFCLTAWLVVLSGVEWCRCVVVLLWFGVKWDE